MPRIRSKHPVQRIRPRIQQSCAWSRRGLHRCYDMRNQTRVPYLGEPHLCLLLAHGTVNQQPWPNGYLMRATVARQECVKVEPQAGQPLGQVVSIGKPRVGSDLGCHNTPAKYTTEQASDWLLLGTQSSPSKTDTSLPWWRCSSFIIRFLELSFWTICLIHASWYYCFFLTVWCAHLKFRIYLHFVSWFVCYPVRNYNSTQH